jgi:hypothetical protein
VSRSFQNRNFLQLAKRECSFGAIGEEEPGFLLGVGLGGPPGVVAVRVAAKHPPAARESFHSPPRRADGRDAQLVGGLVGRQRALPEPVEPIAAEGRGVTMEELLMLFKDEQAARRPCPQPAFKTGCGQGDSCFANYKTCPVLLAPRQC